MLKRSSSRRMQFFILSDRSCWKINVNVYDVRKRASFSCPLRSFDTEMEVAASLLLDLTTAGNVIAGLQYTNSKSVCHLLLTPTANRPKYNVAYYSVQYSDDRMQSANDHFIYLMVEVGCVCVLKGSMGWRETEFNLTTIKLRFICLMAVTTTCH